MGDSSGQPADKLERHLPRPGKAPPRRRDSRMLRVGESCDERGLTERVPSPTDRAVGKDLLHCF